MKVLISDPLSDVGIKIFQETTGIDVDVNTGLTPEELKSIIGQYDGLVIRSATKVTADLLEAAHRLKVVGRAGIGLDNVDIPAASQRGIAVMNTPFGNTTTTAEHAISMLMALSRNIPQATASLKAGKWEKKKLKGRELFNKTLGLIGAGNIGTIVADRAKGLKMKVVIFDPYINPKVSEKLDVEVVALNELLSRADYISIHTPKTEETANLINKKTISKMKKGAMLINCARGGIVNEDDLYDALKDGHLAGAALDVFYTEPPGNIKLMELSNFICTPHLGASTDEAQVNVAKDVAEQIIDFLLNGVARNAVNVPYISSELVSILKPFAMLSEKMGLLHAQLAKGGIEELSIKYAGKISEYDVKSVTAGALKGLLTPAMKDAVNFINAPILAEERGITVLESRTATSEDFTSLVMIKVKTVDRENIVSGTVFGKNLPRLLRVNDLFLEMAPEGHLLLISGENKPGIVGMLGTILGKHELNIDQMMVSKRSDDSKNTILLATSSSVTDTALKELRHTEGVISVAPLEL
ncbi:MAG: phosphoglycerate dehydrogenase [Desulfobacteraceae bacterium]|nr:phosphoglycerate dehydrogenase [Desulfobacteraceae bacterium]